MANPYIWTDNAMEVGIADANPDIVNECLMHLKYEIGNKILIENIPTIANNSSDANNDIDISSGWCLDSTKTIKINILESITKQLDDIFAPGTNQGGLDADTKAVDTWYHVFLIAKEDGTSDVLFSTSSTNPTMPTDYIYKRRIGSIKTDGNGDIIPFIQDGDKFWWSTLVRDVNTNATTSSRTLYTISVPPVKCYADIFVYTDAAANRVSLVTSPLQPDVAPTDVCHNVFSTTPSGVKYFGEYHTSNILAVNSQIGFRSTHNGNCRIFTMGWTDTRGKN